MRVGLQSIDREQFIVRDCVIAGDECALIFPSMLGVDWTPETLHLRSIIVRKVDGLIISRGHDKFLNHGEKPHLYPDPTLFNDWRISTKLDGSLIIVSRYRDEMIVRTRGTSVIDVYETAPEVRALLDQYPQLRGDGPDGATVKDILYSNSLLWEHCTPANRIVIAYPKPSLTLLDIIAHDGTYWSAKQVDQFALVLGCARPETHTFGSLAEITETLKTLEGIEGYVLAYNDNRNRIKLKGLSYLSKHWFKERATLPNTLDLFMEKGCPDLVAFLSQLERDFDAECVELVKGYAISIYQAHLNVLDKIDEIKDGMTTNFMDLPSRRHQAMAIQIAYSGLWQGVCFKLLDKREIDDKMLRKLIEHELGL